MGIAQQCLPAAIRMLPSFGLQAGVVPQSWQRWLPYQRTEEGLRYPAWAEYGIVELRAWRLSIELWRVPIDVDLLVEAVLQSGMPHAEWQVSGWR